MKTRQQLLAISILITQLGLYSSLVSAQSILEYDSDIKFGEPIEANNSKNWENELELATSQPPKELANNAEVIFVSGYEPKNSLRSGNQVKVTINRPGKNVLLILSSYEKIIWQVEASPNTDIQGILVSSYEPSKLITSVSTKSYSVDIPYAYVSENQNFVRVLQELNQWFDVDKVDIFRGSYTLPTEIEISQLDAVRPDLTLAGYPVQEPSNNFEFTLYNRNYLPVKWTLTGEKENKDTNSNLISQTGFAVSPENTKIYELTDNGIKITDKTSGKEEEFELPNNFPRLSWATDIAYDSKRDIVSLVSFGGEGYFYRFDVKNNEWLDVRSLNNIDIQSLTYDRSLDRYIAWANGNLLFISGDGDFLSHKLVRDKLTGFERLYDRDNSKVPTVEIVADGNNLALMTYSGNSVQSIWYYNLDTETVELTYKSEDSSEVETKLPKMP